MKECATIVKVDRIRPGRIHVHFACGVVREVDLKRYARKGTVFEPLSDPDYSRKYRIVDNGHALRWPGGVDFSADSLLNSGKLVTDEEVQDNPGTVVFKLNKVTPATRRGPRGVRDGADNMRRTAGKPAAAAAKKVKARKPASVSKKTSSSSKRPAATPVTVKSNTATDIKARPK